METNLLRDLIELAEDGYMLHISNGSHQEFLSEDREVLAEAKAHLKFLNEETLESEISCRKDQDDKSG